MLAPTLTGRIHHAATHSHTGVTFVSGDVGTRVSWSDLYTDALGYAAVLQQWGIGPGSHVAILGPTTRPLVTAIEAVWLAGATTVVLPLPMRLASIDEFVEQTRLRIQHADVSLLLIDAEFAPFVPPAELPPMLTFAELTAGDAASFVVVEPPADALAVLQFTSGSTAEPKGVMLPHRTVCANLDAIAAAADLVADVDVMVSWLPLYHDMGLVGFLILPMSNGVELVLGAPQEFLGDPARWMRWMSTYRGTATAGPNFAWVLATRALSRSEKLDLSPMRIALNGAEPVDCAAVRRFVDAAAPHGLRPRGLSRVRHGRARDRRHVPDADARAASGPRRSRRARARTASGPMHRCIRTRARVLGASSAGLGLAHRGSLLGRTARRS